MAKKEYSLSLDKAQVEEVTHMLVDVPRGASVAIMRAVNRTGRWVDTRTIRAIADDINVKQKDLRAGAHRSGGVGLRMGTTAAPVATVSVTGRRIPLYRFGAKPTQAPTLRGVTYKIDARGGRKRINHNAFVVETKSGHVGIFKRAGRKRYPVHELFGPSIPQVAINSPELRKALEIDATEKLRTEMKRATDFLLSQGKTGE